MSPREYLRMAWRALTAHRFRSVLTVSSITLGAFSIVLMSSLATSGLATLARDLEELGGARVILVAPKKPERGKKKAGATLGLSRKDRELLFSALPHLSERTVYAALGKKDVQDDRGRSERTDQVAADPRFFRALRLRLAAGRLYTAEENEARAPVCVVAHELAQRLWRGQAVGRWLHVGSEHCLVVGQLAKVEHWGTNFGFEWTDFVALPFETVAETSPAVREQALVHLVTTRPEHNELVKRLANVYLTDQHRGVDDFQIWDFNGFMKQFHTMVALMEAVVGLIAGIALLVGGVGIMNMMLVSVSERTKEIGLRMALGASPRMISAQFLVEAALLAGLGGAAGTTAGAGAALLVHLLIQQAKPEWVGQISQPAAALALLASLAIGAGFGLAPARRAATLTPVEAMRR